MSPGDVSPHTLHKQITDLRGMIAVSGIPTDSLMGKMLTSSLNALDLAAEKQDWATVQRGLNNTKSLLTQCVL